MKKLILVLGLSMVSVLPAAEQYTLKYNLPVGKKLYFSGSNTMEYARGKWSTIQQTEVWVLARNPDSSCHLVLRQDETSVLEPKGGERTQSGPDASWGSLDMMPDGSVKPGSMLGDVGVSSVFIPLPKDTLQAKQGWDRLRELDERDHFRLNSKSLTDSIWVIEQTVKTPLDEVYVISDRSSVYLNVKQGLPVSKEGYSTQSYGNRSTTSTFKLDSIVRLDTARTAGFLTELMLFLRTDSAASALMDKADQEPESALDLMGKADAMFELIHDGLKDSGLQNLAGQRIDAISEAVKRLNQEGGESGLKGKPAPDWKLRDFKGKLHSLKEFRGKVVVMDWWYRGCPWCIRAMPSLNRVAADFAGKPVQVLGMNVDQDTANALFVMDKMKLGYLNLRAGDIDKKYGVTGYPTLFVIDRKGVVRDIHIGYSADLADKLTAGINRLLESK